MTFAYSGLVGVFLCVLLTKRGSTLSVIAALIVGATTVAITQFTPIADDLAWTWGLCVATVLAFIVCSIGRPPSQEADTDNNAGDPGEHKSDTDATLTPSNAERAFAED